MVAWIPWHFQQALDLLDQGLSGVCIFCGFRPFERALMFHFRQQASPGRTNKWAWVVSKFSRVLTGWHRESIAGLASQAFNHMVYSLQSKAKWDGCSLYSWTWIEIWGQMEMKYDEMRFGAKQYSPFDSPCTSLRVCMCIESASMYCFVWMAASENPMWIPGSFALWRPSKAYNATSPILRHRMETEKADWPWNVDSVSRYSGSSSSSSSSSDISFFMILNVVPYV